VSQQNVDVVRRGWEHFEATGELLEDILAPDFVWVMSTFRGVMDFDDEYRGAAGVRHFLAAWTEPFEEWRITAESFRDVGEMVVAVCRQRARSKSAGVPVDMDLAMVFTVRDGLQTRMEMYSDPDEALKAAGLEG
jgi:ketosteroid isomerase-like protein